MLKTEELLLELVDARRKPEQRLVQSCGRCGVGVGREVVLDLDAEAGQHAVGAVIERDEARPQIGGSERVVDGEVAHRVLVHQPAIFAAAVGMRDFDVELIGIAGAHAHIDGQAFFEKLSHSASLR